MTVGDLIERRPDAFGTKNPLMHGRVIAKSSRTGKQLFDTSENKSEHIEKYYNHKVGDMWTDIKVHGNNSFSMSYAEPVLMLYVDEV